MKQRSLYFLLASVCFGSHQAYSASKLLVKRTERIGARPRGWRASMQALKRRLRGAFGHRDFDVKVLISWA
jgi:hypothetical protein